MQKQHKAKPNKNKNTKATHIRVLASAYSSGRIERNEYIKERTRQLAAIEFGKPLPPLPEDLLDIRIPTIKIDASYISSKRRQRRTIKIIIICIALLGIGGTAAGLWFAGVFSPQPQPQAQVKQPKLSDYANRLLQNPNWSKRDIIAFLRVWATHSSAAREKVRRATWYVKLDNEIIKRINQAKLRLGAAEKEEQAAIKNELELLRAFQAKLSSN